MDIWNCRYSDFHQGPMTVYLHLYSTNFVSQFLLWSSIRTCLQSSHYEDNHYIFLCCECQSLSMPNKACPKVQSFLVFGLFFYWFLNYTRGRAFRREISNIHTVWLKINQHFYWLKSVKVQQAIFHFTGSSKKHPFLDIYFFAKQFSLDTYKLALTGLTGQSIRQAEASVFPSFFS